MPLGKTRNRVLARQRGKNGTHRYEYRRIAIGIVASLLVAWIPLGGILRFDLWDGRHVVLGEPASLVTAVRAFAFPFLAVNILILFGTRFWGRYLCGFGCPVGAFARMGEALRFPRKGQSQLQRLRHILLLGAGALTIAGIVFAFWVDPRVFLEGSAGARAGATAFLLGLTAGVFLGARRLGLGFCRDWCPSGVYFALLGHETRSGVELRHPESCTDCKLCEVVCPVDLEPRTLHGVHPNSSRGFYPEGLSHQAICLRCGDCIRACEDTTGTEKTALALGPLTVRAEEDTVCNVE